MAMEDSSIGDRIGKILSHYGLKSGELAERIGVKAGTMSHFMSGRNKPSFDVLARLLESFPSLSPDWVIHGMGEIERSVGHMQERANHMAEQNLAVQGQRVMPENPQSVNASTESPSKAGVTDTNTVRQANKALSVSTVGPDGAVDQGESILFPQDLGGRSERLTFTTVNQHAGGAVEDDPSTVRQAAPATKEKRSDFFTGVNYINAQFGGPRDMSAATEGAPNSQQPQPSSATNSDAIGIRKFAPGVSYPHYQGIRREISKVSPHAYAADESGEKTLGASVSNPATRRRGRLWLDVNDDSRCGMDSGKESNAELGACGSLKKLQSERATHLKPPRESVDLFTDVTNRVSAFSLAMQRDGNSQKLRTQHGKSFNCVVHSHSHPDTNAMYKNGDTSINKKPGEDTSVETKVPTNVDRSIAEFGEIILLLPEGQYLRFTPSKGASE